jgi:hypothetical protein
LERSDFQAASAARQAAMSRAWRVMGRLSADEWDAIVPPPAGDRRDAARGQ